MVDWIKKLDKWISKLIEQIHFQCQVTKAWNMTTIQNNIFKQQFNWLFSGSCSSYFFFPVYFRNKNTVILNKIWSFSVWCNLAKWKIKTWMAMKSHISLDWLFSHFIQYFNIIHCFNSYRLNCGVNMLKFIITRNTNLYDYQSKFYIWWSYENVNEWYKNCQVVKQVDNKAHSH